MLWRPIVPVQNSDSMRQRWESVRPELDGPGAMFYQHYEELVHG